MNRIQKWAKLCGFMNQIVSEVTNDDEILIKEVLDRHKKGREVTRVRETILGRVRTEIWELNSHNSPQWDIEFTKTPKSVAWKPVGYISIARILGGDHSAWVRMAKKMRDATVVTS